MHNRTSGTATCIPFHVPYDMSMSENECKSKQSQSDRPYGRFTCLSMSTNVLYVMAVVNVCLYVDL